MKLFGLARLGRDGEMRKLPSGESVVNLALAYNYGRKDESGNKPTQWVDAAFFGSRAEALYDWLVKGQQFLVEVRDIHVETYPKSDGTQGVKLVGVVDNIEFAGPPPGQQQGGGQQAPQQQRQQPQQQQRQPQQQSRQQAPQQRQAAPQQQQRQQPQNPGGGSGFDDMDDSIPF